MAVNLSVLVRNAMLDSIEVVTDVAAKLKIFTGAKPTACADADPAGLLATFSLPSNWMADASTGMKVLAGSWSTTGAGAGVPGVGISFRVYKTDGTTCEMQGSVGVGSGDLQLDNNNIASGQTVTITGFTLTAPNA